jgi:hypothetical protein
LLADNAARVPFTALSTCITQTTWPAPNQQPERAWVDSLQGSSWRHGLPANRSRPAAGQPSGSGSQDPSTAPTLSARQQTAATAKAVAASQMMTAQSSGQPFLSRTPAKLPASHPVPGAHPGPVQRVDLDLDPATIAHCAKLGLSDWDGVPCLRYGLPQRVELRAPANRWDPHAGDTAGRLAAGVKATASCLTSVR